MTWGRLLEALNGILSDSGPDARADAAWIACEAAGVDRAGYALLLRDDCPEDARRRAETMAAERAAERPLQYVLGWTPFMGLRIRCDERALIPRPETEELASLAVAWAREHHAKTALDLGTGSGALALALAAADMAVDAVDLSDNALSLARENAASCGLERRVRFYRGSWYEPLPAGAGYDLIVANPPYIARGEIAALAALVTGNEPRMALDGGEDGLDAYRAILGHLPLAPGGAGWLEVGAGQAEAVCAIAQEGGREAEAYKDMRGIARFVCVT